mmetsp:Transcript_5071/g.12961  ORF Transcript_5071/g.12961 Transcript_5071/m.12961 type:complete len:214 (-) Transcript_5071:1216-1857(-)
MWQHCSNQTLASVSVYICQEIQRAPLPIHKHIRAGLKWSVEYASGAWLRASWEVITSPPLAVHVACHQAEHALVLVGMVVHVNHDWKLRRRLGLPWNVTPPAGAEKYLGVHEFENVHHTDADLRAVVVAMRGEPHLFVEDLLVPARAGQQAGADAAHELYRAFVGTQKDAAHIQREHLQVQPAASPAHGLVGNAAKLSIRPLGSEAVCLAFQV